MTEHLFDTHDFGTIFEQVRSEAVAQHVRRRLAFPADFAEQVLNVVSESP